MTVSIDNRSKENQRVIVPLKMERSIKPWLSADDPNYTFINANVVHAVEGSIKPNTTVRVSNGRIKAVQPEPYTATPDDSPTIDLAGK